MYKYLLEHEEYIKELLNSSEENDWESIKEYHKVKIVFMQHERLVHLLVTLAFAFVMLASYVVFGITNSLLLIAVSLLLTTLEIFYIVHYYRLENGIQRWYKLYDAICERCRK